MTPDERADALAEIAAQLVGRVRDDDPEAFHRWVRNAMLGAGFTAPDDDALAMFTVLACAVPTDKTWLQLTQWRWQQQELTTERFGPVPNRERYARPRPLPQAVDRRGAA